MTKDGLKVGVVGTGFGQLVHVPAWRRDDRCEVLSLCGRDLNRTKAIANRLDIAHANSHWRELIGDANLDIISIACEPELQTEIALAALAAGKDVFCEKPLAHSMEAATRLVSAAARSGRACMVDFEFFEMSPWRRAQELLASGQIGRLRHVAVNWNVQSSMPQRDLSSEWKRDANRGGGILSLFGSHTLYCLEQLVGRIEKIHGHLQGPLQGQGAETAAFIGLEFEQDLSGVAAMSCHGFGRNSHRVELFGDEGMLLLENNNRDYINGFDLFIGKAQVEGLKKVEVAGALDQSFEDGRVAAVGRVMKRFLDWVQSGEKQGGAIV